MNNKVKKAKNGVWYKITEFEICCDCGLKHRKEYKIVFIKGVPTLYHKFWRLNQGNNYEK